VGNDHKIDDTKSKISETSLNHKHDYFKIMLGERATPYLSLPFAACIHTEAYPQVSGHLGGNQDPADKKEDSSIKW
jgi:hypothetical protein